MSIETLMSAAEAAGYVMAAEEELPTGFGDEPEVLEYRSQPATAVAIWRPVVPDIDGQPVIDSHIRSAWSWVAGRWLGFGAPA